MKSLVAFFSAGGRTRRAAMNVAAAADAALYEIVPETPYTAKDLDWTDGGSRSTVEMHNLAFRPKMIQTDAGVAQYDTIFLGFPIWWHMAPTIVNTFVERYDFSGKNIVLFATSGGSGMDQSMRNLMGSVSPDARFMGERILSGRESAETLRSWINGLGL